jgi:hypothetical protein
MTNDDWRALLESFLSDDTDTESFKEEFIEGWKAAREEGTKVPKVIGDLFYTIENFNTDEDDETDLRDEAQKAVAALEALS